MNNGLAVAIHAARMFGVSEDFTLQDDCYLHEKDDVIIYRNYRFINQFNYRNKVNLNSSHKELADKLLPIVQHYAQGFGINYHDNTIYITPSEWFTCVWRFDGLNYRTIISFHSSVKYIKTLLDDTDDIDDTLYIMNVPQVFV